MTRILRTPAKLNLGLEIVRKRPDGLHDLATVFQAVDIYDELRLYPASEFAYTSDPAIAPEDDLVRPIIEQAAEEQGWTASLALTKGIPIAAGLGGGSSDAALALRLRHARSAHGRTVDLAARIGADVPFFLRGGTARGEGIGELLTPLPTPDLWFVVHTPDVRLERKTRSLFQGLIAGDFTDGSAVDAISSILRSGSETLPDALPNAFERQMREVSVVATAWRELRSLSGRVALTGAGPSIYSWHRTRAEARAIAVDARSALGRRTFLCRAIPEHDDREQLLAFHERLVRHHSV